MNIIAYKPVNTDNPTTILRFCPYLYETRRVRYIKKEEKKKKKTEKTKERKSDTQ